MVDNPSIDQSFNDVFHNYAYSIEGYRLFLEHLHESIGSLDDDKEAGIREHARRIGERLDPEDRRDVRNSLEAFAKRLQELIEGRDDDEEAQPTRTESDHQSRPLEADNHADDDGDGNGFALKLSGPAASAILEMLESARRDRWIGVEAQRRLLYRSVITGLVGQFEVLVADIAHQFYRRAPNALDTSTPVLSISELRRIGSVDAAFALLVEKKTDELLTQSVDDWAAFFEGRMKIDLSRLSRDWPMFREFIQRRHIIVHAGGRITRRYLDNVDDELLLAYFDEPVVGAPAELDREYVDAALDHFEQIGILLCLTAWVKLQRDELARLESVLQDWVYKRLIEERWEMALAVAEQGIDSKRLSTAAQVVCRMNAWLCLKRLGRFEEVRQDVEAFDVSALENRFKIVRLALLDRSGDLLTLIEATEGRDLDHKAWYEWPLLDEVRNEERFGELAERFAPGKEKKSEEADQAAATDASSGDVGAVTSDGA